MPITFLTTQGNGGTAVPYTRRNLEGTHTTELTHSPQDSIRLARIEEGWRFYLGLHWSFSREDGDPLVTANYARAVVDKKASWLVGNDMTLSVPDAFVKKTKPVLEEVWKYNGGKAHLLRMAKMGGVTGDVNVLVTYQEPTSKQLAINPHTRGSIRLRLLGSHQVFPTWDPLNQEKLKSLKIITHVDDPSAPTPREDYRYPPQSDNPTDVPMPNFAGIQMRKYVEIITEDYIEEGWEHEGPLKRRPNTLGEIPLVHITNEAVPNEYYGLSDLDGIIDMQRTFNEVFTDLLDIVNYHAHPITIVTGAKARSLEKSAKGMWCLPKDATAFNLQLGGDLAMSHRTMEAVLKIIFDLSGVPEGSLGRIQSISNTSAAALQVQFQPLIEAIQRKAPEYERGIERINYFILRYWELENQEKLPTNLCKHCGGQVIEFKETLRDGRTRTRRKCYLVNPDNFDLMHPDDVKVSVKREFSFGSETRMMPFAQAKKESNTIGASYWDPQPMKDKKKEAEINQVKQEIEAQLQSEVQQSQMEADTSVEQEAAMQEQQV